MSLSVSVAGILNFCANNYLGLSSHPEVVKAGVDALHSHGAGLSSVRFICGTQVPVAFHRRECSSKMMYVVDAFAARRSTEAFRLLIPLQDIHKNLEQKLAEFHQREDCILYASCFDANAGLFEVAPLHAPPSRAENPKTQAKKMSAK